MRGFYAKGVKGGWYASIDTIKYNLYEIWKERIFDV